MRRNTIRIILLSSFVVILSLLLSANVFAKDYTDSDPAYRKIAGALADTDASVDLTGYEVRQSDLSALIEKIICDEPEYGYLDSYKYGYEQDTGFLTKITFSYRSYAGDVVANRAAYNKELDRIAALCDPNWPDAAKALFINDYMVSHYEYAYSDPNADIYHRGYQLALNKVGVCEAYAEVFQKIMTRLGIPCVYMQSETMYHKWNAVRIDGNWYHVDVTWNDPRVNGTAIYGYISHKYFLLSDTAVKTDSNPHENYDSSVVCSSTKYDDCFWRSVVGAIAFDGSNYYYVNPTIDSGKFNLYKTSSTGAGTKIGTISSPWYVGDRRYASPYASLWYKNGNLYFNSPAALCRYEISSGRIAELISAPAGTALCFATLDGNILSANALNMENYAKISSVCYDITQHVHVFDQKKTDAKYLLSGASYSSAAIYYYSCTCGEKGTDTFTYGSPLTTTAPVTTVVITTCAATTKPVTTKPVTTKIVTTKAVTTKAITTALATTVPVTTKPVTTSHVTTAPITTTAPTTTALITTTSVPVTTDANTTAPISTISETSVETDVPTTPSQTTEYETPVSTTINTQTPKTQVDTEEKGNPKLVRVVIIILCLLVIIGGVALLISRRSR